METKSEGGKKPTAEQLVKNSLVEQTKKTPTPFGMSLVELVTTEAILSKQSAHMAKLLGEKLEKRPPLKLSSAERALLEKAKEYYQEIANNPYPLFTSDEAQRILSKEPSKNEQADPLADLANLEGNNTVRAQIINTRIEIFQWITLHIGDLQQAINAKNKPAKFKLKADAPKEERFNIYDQQSEATRYLNEYDVVSDCLSPPIQRLARLVLLTDESLKKTSEEHEKQLHTTLKILGSKWQSAASETNQLIAYSQEEKIGLLVKKLTADKLPYVIPLLGEEFTKKEDTAKQLNDLKKFIKTYEKATHKPSEEDKLFLTTKKAAAKILEKNIKTTDGILEKKINTFFTLSDKELEIFSAFDPKSTSALRGS